jgi:6-phospho-beta-glucosidase
VKVAVVGGGGFRTPLVLRALEHVPGLELVVLQDPSEERLRRIEAVGRALHRERPAPFRVQITRHLDRAVSGASAVLAAIRPGGAEGRVVDESVPLAHGILGQETVGPGGICFALRTVPAMRRVASVVARRASDAWFVNFTNPAGIVTEAVRDILGDRALGICDSPRALCARVASCLGQKADALAFDYAGLNHLGWLLGAHDEDGRDLVPALLADEDRLDTIEEARSFGTDRVRAIGAIPNEYLVYLEHADQIVRRVRTAGSSRAQIVASQQQRFFEAAPGTDEEMLAVWRDSLGRRHATYMEETRGAADEGPPHQGTAVPPSDEGVDAQGYGAVAALLLRAATTDERSRLIVNTANRGRIEGIPDDEVVEVSCEVSREGVLPLRGARLPPEPAVLVARIKEVERLTIRAATAGSARLAIEAVAAHPLVPSRAIAERIIGDFLELQPGLREAIR